MKPTTRIKLWTRRFGCFWTPSLWSIWRLLWSGSSRHPPQLCGFLITAAQARGAAPPELLMAPLYLLLHFKTYFKFHFLPFLDPFSDKKALESPSQRVLPCTACIFTNSFSPILPIWGNLYLLRGWGRKWVNTLTNIFCHESRLMLLSFSVWKCQFDNGWTSLFLLTQLLFP